MAAMTAIVLVAAPTTLTAQGNAQQQGADNLKSAQQKAAGKQDNVQRKRDKAAAAFDSTAAEARRADADHKDGVKASKEKAPKEAKGKGNAYGRDKDGLQGRDFGQARAAQARLQGEKADTLKVKTDKAMETVTTAREKVNQAKTALDKARKEGKLSEARYEEKAKKVEAAHQAIDKLEEKARQGKELLEGDTEQDEQNEEAVEGDEVVEEKVLIADETAD